MTNEPLEVSYSGAILVTTLVLGVATIAVIIYFVVYQRPSAKDYNKYLNMTLCRFGKNIMKISYEEFLLEYYSSWGRRCRIDTYTVNILILALKPLEDDNEDIENEPIGLIFSLRDYRKLAKWYTTGAKVPNSLAKTLADVYDQYDKYMETTYHEKDNGD